MGVIGRSGIGYCHVVVCVIIGSCCGPWVAVVAGCLSKARTVIVGNYTAIKYDDISYYDSNVIGPIPKVGKTYDAIKVPSY